MTNEDEMLAGAGLPKWFKGSVRALVGVIRLAAEAGGSAGTATDNATKHPGDLRHRAARDVVGFQKAARAVLFAVQELDAYTEQAHVNAQSYVATVDQLKANSIGALGHLVEVLRQANPSDATRALFID